MAAERPADDRLALGSERSQEPPLRESDPSACCAMNTPHFQAQYM
jgi:hypothetical protein